MHLNKSLKPERWIFNAFSKCCNLTLDYLFFCQIWTIDVKVVIASVASLLNNWFYILRNCTSFVLCKIPLTSVVLTITCVSVLPLKIPRRETSPSFTSFPHYTFQKICTTCTDTSLVPRVAFCFCKQKLKSVCWINKMTWSLLYWVNNLKTKTKPLRQVKEFLAFDLNNSWNTVCVCESF